MTKDITDWLYKYNLEKKIFYSNFSVPKMEFEVINSNFTDLLYTKNIISNNKNNVTKQKNINLKIDANIFIKETGLTKWDYILENYFNHFNINKFSNILFINHTKNINPKDKIKQFYHIDNVVISSNSKNKKLILKKKYDLICIFTFDYKISNDKKNINIITCNILTILLNLCNYINDKTIIFISFLYEKTVNSCDLIFFLENYFDITFFSEYKLQDIDKTTVDIILSNGRDFLELKNNLKKILNIYKIKEKNIGFIKYKFIPKTSSFFIYNRICEFLHARYHYFLKLNLKNENKIQDVYKKMIFNQIFTQDIKHNNVIQIPFLMKLLNKESSFFFKEGNILYNFVINKKLNNVFQFGFYNGYISIFILMGLNKLEKGNKILITTDSRQQRYYKSIGTNLLQKLNIFKNHLLVEDNIYNYILSLIEKKKKFKLIILHNVLVENFQELMMEFYFSLQLVKENSFIYVEKIHFPKIKKMIHYITNNLSFLNIYYKTSFSIIFKVNDGKLLQKYLNKDPLKQFSFYDF